MALLKMTIPHKLSQEEAMARIKGLLGKLKKEQKDKISNLKEEWSGDTANFQFTTQGFDLSGVIRVQPSSVDIDAKVPFAVSLFQGKIKQLVEEKAREILS